MTALLEVRDLAVTFAADDGPVRAVDGVSFALTPGRRLAIVGESGCGKSVTALAIMRLLAPGARADGTVRLDGEDVLAASDARMRQLRGGRIAMIFQEPMTSLNPAFTAGDQIVEAIREHSGVSAAKARAQAIAWLARVRIPAPERRFGEYPHRLSGGMRQRVMIAMAMACRPAVLIADEPTTALDVTIQAQILGLLRQLSDETGTAIVLITHDLGVVAELAHDVLVMYAGRVAEQAPVEALFRTPQHPYTVGLMGAVPRLDAQVDRLATIEGAVPNPRAWPPGCRFAPRCPFVIARCHAEVPPFAEAGQRHVAACFQAPLDRFVAAA